MTANTAFPTWHRDAQGAIVFVKMRVLSEDGPAPDIAGYILVASQVSGIQWGGGPRSISEPALNFPSNPAAGRAVLTPPRETGRVFGFFAPGHPLGAATLTAS